MDMIFLQGDNLIYPAEPKLKQYFIYSNWVSSIKYFTLQWHSEYIWKYVFILLLASLFEGVLDLGSDWSIALHPTFCLWLIDIYGTVFCMEESFWWLIVVLYSVITVVMVMLLVSCLETVHGARLSLFISLHSFIVV